MRHNLHATLLLALSASPALAQSTSQNLSSSNPEISSVNLPDDPSAPLQQTATPATPPQNETDAQRKAREQKEESDREVKSQEKQRAGGIMPLFNVVISGQTVPLSPKQKFDLSFHTIIDPYTIGLAVVIGGGFGELDDSHTGYGHGPSGLFKRIGASYADNVDGNLIGNALLPVLLHQDPRYYRQGTGTIKSRILHSAITTFVCFGDNGKKQFNTSNVAGNFISGAISNAYYPSNERGVGLTIENGVTVTLEGMLGAQLLEFSPDFNAYLQRRRQRKLDARTPTVQTTQTPAPGPTPQPKP